MTNDIRTANEIERDIEDERAQLTGTINDLQKKFSVEAIVSDLGSMFRDQGGEWGRSITSTVGRNPAAVVLVGVGLAWLVLGQGRSAEAAAPRGGRTDTRRPGNDTPDAWNKPPIPTGRGAQIPSHSGDRYWFDDYGVSDDHGLSDTVRTDAKPGDEPDSVIGKIKDGAESVAGAVSGAAGAVRDAAVDLTDRLASGTEGLPEDAKARVLAARRLARDARIASQDAMQRGGRAASNLFEDQPLAMGALAVALGAALGGVLPHSRIEDDALGAKSDQLFADAQRVFQEERAKAMAVVKAAAGEAQGALKDAGSDLADLLPDGKSAGDVIVDQISETATRIADTAKDEATRQGLLAERQS